MLRVASHGFAEQHGNRDQSDYEVVQMARWLRQKTRRVERGERIVTFRELKRILLNRGFDFEDLRDNSIELIRYEDEKTFFGFGKTKRVRKRIMRMSYPGDGAEVGRDMLRELRMRCGLTNEDGVDSAAFYTGMRDPDFFVSRYRGTLRRLAKV
jgi:death-on-curing protein